MISFEFQRSGGLVAAPGLVVHAHVEIVDLQTGTVSVDGARIRSLAVPEIAVLLGAIDGAGMASGAPSGANRTATPACDQYQFTFGIERADGRRTYLAPGEAPPALQAWAAHEADALVAARFARP